MNTSYSVAGRPVVLGGPGGVSQKRVETRREPARPRGLKSGSEGSRKEEPGTPANAGAGAGFSPWGLLQHGPSVQVCQLPVTLLSVTHFHFSQRDWVPVLCVQKGLQWS